MLFNPSHLLEALTQLAILVFSLSFHEMAHAYAADKLGDPTPRLMGRLTLNPVVHADLLGTIIFPLLRFIYPGLLLFGWAKPVPITSENFKNPRRDNALVALAGPAANVLLCFFSLLGLFVLNQTGFFGMDQAGQMVLWDFFKFFFWLNFALAVFNMIPIFPLDGSWVLKALLPGPMAYQYSRMDRWGFLVLILAMYIGVLNLFFEPAIRFLFFCLNGVGLDNLTSML